MRPCPSCGHANDADATACALCGRPLAPLSAQESPLAPPPGVSGNAPPPQPAPGGLQPPPGFSPTSDMPPSPIPIPYGVPVQLHPQQSTGSKVGQFFLGVGIGLLAAVISLYGSSALVSLQVANGNLALLGCIPGLAAFVGMIVFLSISRFRFIGYGLLAVLVGAPVIFFIGCIVVLTHASHP